MKQRRVKIADIERFMGDAQAFIDAYFESIGASDWSLKLFCVVGYKYANIYADRELPKQLITKVKWGDAVRRPWNSHIWGFIRLTNGDCLRVRSFSDPYHASPRGNIFDNYDGMKYVHWNGFSMLQKWGGLPNKHARIQQ
jgi:hypothetical protein